MKFEIEVTETRAVHMRYVVEARSAREAENMAAIGSTTEEHHMGDGGVLDRTLTTKATPIPSQNQQQFRIAMDISARVDAEIVRAYLLGAKGAEAGTRLIEGNTPLALLAALALTHDAPKLEEVGLADLTLTPYPPEDTAYPTFRLEVTVTDPERLEEEATAMFVEPDDLAGDLAEMVYEALIGSNGGPAHLDFGVEFLDRRTLEVEPVVRITPTHQMPDCGACGSPLVIDGTWPDGAPTYVDGTGGDVCAVNGANDRHQPGVEALASVAAPTLER